MSEVAQPSMLDLTTRIVAAHIGHNEIAANAVPDLIRSVYRSLSSASEVAVESAPSAEAIPAVPVKKSVFPDYLVCLEDGKKLKMLKRHLKISYDMTPADYREKWRLPASYPMVAPNYATTRSRLAKTLGLGRKARVESTIEPERVDPEVTMVPARRAKGSRG